MLLVLTLLLHLLSLLSAQFVYQGSRKLDLTSNKIVWSDSRFVQFQGTRESFIVDFQSNFDRFRNIIDPAENNVTMKDSFRSKGRVYEKLVAPKCKYSSAQLPEMHYRFATSSGTTYFVLKADSLKLAILDSKCTLTFADFQKIQTSTLKEVLNIDNAFLAIRTQKVMYVVNKITMEITQELNLEACSIIDEDSLFHFWQNTYLYQLSLRLYIVSENGICSYERLSQNSDFRLLNVHKSYFYQYQRIAQINDSVAFITNQNCTLIKLNISNVNSNFPEVAYTAALRDQIVDTAAYTYWPTSSPIYYRSLLYLKSGEMMSLELRLSSDGTLPLTPPLQSACGGNYLANARIHFFIDADQVTKRFYNTTTTVLTSVKDYKFQKIGCAINAVLKNSQSYPVIGALISQGYLNVVLFDGYYNSFWDKNQIQITDNFKVNSILVGQSSQQYDAKYFYFFTILTNTQTNTLRCYSFLVNSSKLTLMGKRDINAAEYQTGSGLSVMWHEVIDDKNYVMSLTGTLDLSKYEVGYDFQTFQGSKFCDCFRVVRTSGRVDLYLSSPLQRNRVGSYYVEGGQNQLYALYNPRSNYVYVEYSDKFISKSINPSQMFYGKTIDIRPQSFCQDSYRVPIFGSTQSSYTTQLSLNEVKNKQRLTILQTYYEPYYGNHVDNISYISFAYNASVTFHQVNTRFFPKQNTIIVEMSVGDDFSKFYLAGLRLDNLQLNNDYLLWDWMIQLEVDSYIRSFELDQSSLILWEEGGKISRFEINGLPTVTPPNGIQRNQMPYLVAKEGGVVGYYGYYAYYTDKTIFSNPLTGQQLFLLTSRNVLALSPSGSLLAEKSPTNASELNVYRQINVIGRIKLTKALSESSKVWFMNENTIIQFEPVDFKVQLYLFEFIQDPFTYRMYSFASGGTIVTNLISFNQDNIAVGTTSKVLILDNKLNTVQTLTTSFVETGTLESLSIGQGGGKVYGKVNTRLYIWSAGECSNDQTNNQGICEAGGSTTSSGELVGIIAGSVGGAVALGTLSFFLIRRWKKNKGKSLLQSEGLE